MMHKIYPVVPFSLLDINSGLILQFKRDYVAHDETWTFPISFTEPSYYVSEAIWIDQIGHVAVTKTVSDVSFKCSTRHMRVGDGLLVIGY